MMNLTTAATAESADCAEFADAYKGWQDDDVISGFEPCPSIFWVLVGLTKEPMKAILLNSNSLHRCSSCLLYLAFKDFQTSKLYTNIIQLLTYSIQ